MPSRKFNLSKLSPEVKRARRAVWEKGYTRRALAAALGRDISHVSQVLCGHRESKRLLKAIHHLPPVA